MPRVSRAEAESHRQQITEASARLFKERGINGVSVADLMGAAGLTHGGFYGHFQSKDALAGVAVAHAFAQSAERWRKRVAAQPDDAAGRAAIVDKFLSAQSIKEVGLGCPSVSLSGRSGKTFRPYRRKRCSKPIPIAIGLNCAGSGCWRRTASTLTVAPLVVRPCRSYEP